MQLQFNFDPDLSRLESAFWRFHDRHPEVYNALLQFSQDWRTVHGAGACLGIGKLFEEVRWEMNLQLEGGFPKLNNNHRAYYARLLMDQHRELAGMFKLRQQRIPASFGPANQALPRIQHVA